MTNKLILWVLALTLSLSVMAQKTYVKENPDENFRKGLELFNKQKFGLSNLLFSQYFDQKQGSSGLMLNDARYFSSVCALELFNSNAEIRFNEFIANNPESSRIPDARYRLGISQFRAKKYKKVLEYFSKVDPYYLNDDEFAEYQFKLGYSHFADSNFTDASKAFYEIKDKENKYASPAEYFYSHIAYLDGNFEKALEGFTSLIGDELFGTIVPYYISHIYFHQKKYESVISYAPPMLDSISETRKPTIAKLIGESHYHLRQWSQAIPYFEMYNQKTTQLTRGDMFQLGYCYFQNAEFQKTVDLLSKISLLNDSISQHASYLMAGSHLQLNNKKSARLAFESAAKIDFDKTIQEDALFNYAKLTHELSLSPFNEAINAFQEYINKYPNSERLDEVYGYLSKVYMSTKNYEEAIEILENIQKITPEIEEAYQRVTFFRALEEFNNSNYQNSIILFDKSLNNAKYNKTYHARSLFWKGEAYYQINRFNDAIREFNKFLITTGSLGLSEFNTVHYNLGYCHFKNKNYLESATWFRKYTDMLSNAQSKTVGDAFARAGDCYFISREYDQASVFYQKAIDNGKASVDYAMFQRGFCMGLLKDHNQKIIAMNQLISDFPKSSYVDDAYLEIGNSYVAIEEPNMAVNAYKQIIDDYPTSNLVPKAYLQIGLVYYNSDQNEKSLETFKKVVEFFPNSPESKEALGSLKNVYLELNQVEEYYAYMKEKDGKTDIRITEQDSLMYASAEKVYMNGDYKKSEDLFVKYLDKMGSSGIFFVNSSYYLAECFVRNGSPEKAVDHLSNVLSKPTTTFTEPSLLKLANWHYKDSAYDKAFDYYTRLEAVAQFDNNRIMARTGRMRSAFKLNNLSEARKSAIQLLGAEKVSDEVFREAHYIIGKEAFAQNQLEDAMDEFKLIAQECKTVEQAEAKYLTAKIYFMQNQLELSEKEVFDFVKKNTPHQYWLAKSFLLLSDIYIQKNDLFQAKATLNSINDNYANKTDGIIDEAAIKLNEIQLKENPPKIEEQPIEPVMEIDFENKTLE